MVILSAGTINSPLVLERSGIGSRATLANNGVDQIVDLPGVGENLREFRYLYTRSSANG